MWTKARQARRAQEALFADPHFNVMDGLDTYIDDYGKPDPIPPDVLRRLGQSETLGLFDTEETPEATEPPPPAQAAAALARCREGRPRRAQAA
ncbi:DUF3306 domain-containing protein [Cupriavidus basilensis]